MARVEFSKKVRAEAAVKEKLRHDPSSGLLFWKASGEPAGGFTSEGYRRVKINGVTFQAHRIAWFLHAGTWPSLAVDHINGDKADNRISNLRLATVSENGRNRSTGRNSRSGVVGVCWSARHKAWRTYIKTDDGNKHLGYFKDLGDAVSARKQAEAAHGYSPYHGRQQP